MGWSSFSPRVLKEAIAGELKYTERADQLQLFMAKKKDGTWLDGAGAIQASVALDERGRPQGFAVMNPILFIKNPKHFGDNFQPGEGQIHVLVVVPVERAAKRQKVEPSALAGAWSTVAGQMVELSKDLKPNDLEEGKIPNTENYNDFVEEMCFRVIMNPWTKTECQSLADINCIGDQDDWYHKFNLVGGRPRFVFSSETFDDLVRRVKANIPQNQSTLEDTVQLFKHERLRDDMHIPFLFRRDPDTPSRPFLTYASVAVEAIIANKARYRGDAV
ncbi:hypothetical protein PR001_g2610 [Phytophthora rubi]|uniref:Crinkler effector protein N-terminal domain-containing protein n=1 Tax=Phytophthora rubi TaxID=129364 RepID=A0A6A3NXE6_9STRA|nr:hypothetical protein PR001_g2610 [Phytophthora rubi]